MSTSAGPNIVEDGLVLYVDAANENSYPGSGTTWHDMSGNGHNISLGSSVNFSNSNAGVLNFPKDANGYGRNTSMNLSSNNYTVVSFVRKLANADGGRTITAYNNNWLLGHHDSTYGDYYAQGWIYSGAGTSDTVWRMFAGTGDISNDSYNLYINKNKTISNSTGGSQGPNGWNLNNQYGQYSNCQIANLICYNRALSDAEIEQNFNALRGRYGI